MLLLMRSHGRQQHNQQGAAMTAPDVLAPALAWKQPSFALYRVVGDDYLRWTETFTPSEWVNGSRNPGVRPLTCTHTLTHIQ
mmetsp:Transcript_18974/g.40781  ORF Transcript_18974/g.40781 Transcript_18974/m.40781 type:complete len:82 (-) Transcript_18974:67-312(-)